MFIRNATYIDFNGVERKEDFYFNLTEAEILKMEWGEAGGLADQLLRILKKKDAVEIMKTFDKLIDASYGVKSPDGRLFIKNPEVLAEFKATQAYSDLYKEICTDSEKAIKFVMEIIPVAVDEKEINKMMEENGLNSADMTVIKNA